MGKGQRSLPFRLEKVMRKENVSRFVQACLSMAFQARIIAGEVKKDENGSLGLEWDVIG